MTESFHVLLNQPVIGSKSKFFSFTTNRNLAAVSNDKISFYLNVGMALTSKHHGVCAFLTVSVFTPLILGASFSKGKS